MIKEAKILRATIINPILDMIADHEGLLLEEAGQLVVYHNNPSPDNQYGGNIVKQSLVDFMRGRELDSEEAVWIDTNKFYAYLNANLTREYHLIEYNCEQFIREALYGARVSPQLRMLGDILLLYLHAKLKV